MVKVSILMPAYIDTVEKLDWFGEAVRSVTKQTFSEWELIVIDDASPTRLALAEPDERIRLFRMVNRVGPALCRNTAAALARGEALLPLDADDLLLPETLERLYVTWQANPGKIIYGDLQRLDRIAGRYQPGRVFGLPDYTFERSLDLDGIMPVTALHSIDCHHRAGGWKAKLEAGLEDVEYWIAAGKAGFCGLRVPVVTLLYRKHDESRSSRMRNVTRRMGEMRALIKEIHQDVFNGRYPMGCCGGSKAYVPPPANNSVAAPISLASVPANQKVWVEYRGKRRASFGIVGPFTNHTYMINGPGHKIEVHVKDLSKFQRAGRGNDFAVGVQSPAAQPVELVETTNRPFTAAAPELAQVERLDRIAVAAS